METSELRTLKKRNAAFQWLGWACLLLYILVHLSMSKASIKVKSWPGNVEKRQAQQKPFSFKSIDPAKHIEWRSCYASDVQCARLDVPLDWNNASDTRRAAVAIIRLPAKVPVTSPNYGGPILINPGGPGGSGVNLALQGGRMLQTIVDSPNDPGKAAKHDLYFDIIGFDPRGVNNTTPSITCFPDDGARQNFEIQASALGIVRDGASFRTTWNRIEAVARTCSKFMSVEGQFSSDAGRFVSTPVVVTDMLEIAERLAEWRDKQAKALVGSCSKPACLEILDRTRWHKGAEMVQYIGQSYGTVLGATLATMHPNRIKRVLIDGVVDMDDYYAGTWLSNLQDADIVMNHFYDQCHRVGPRKCALYSATGPSGSKAMLEQALSALQYAPIPVVAGQGVAPDVVTYTDLMNLIREAVYSPQRTFESLALAIFETTVGNGTLLAKSKQSWKKPFCPSPECRTDGPWSDACTNDMSMFKEELSAAIYCTDAPDLTATGLDFHLDKWDTLHKQSWALGGYWSEITSYCANWHLRPAWRFQGEKPSSRVGGDTAHPILFATNTWDPVTPIRNARKISSRFKGSVVLEQRTEGHCATASPSLCVAKHVRQYFQTGRLPENGTVCEPGFDNFGDKPPFDDCEGLEPPTNCTSTPAGKDTELVETLKEWTTRAEWKSGLTLGM